MTATADNVRGNDFQCTQCKGKGHTFLGAAPRLSPVRTGEDEYEDACFDVVLLGCMQCQALTLWETCPDFETVGAFPHMDFNDVQRLSYCTYIESRREEPNVDFKKFDPYQEELLERWYEAQICITSGAYLAAMILMGSLLESVLLLAVEKNMKAALDCTAAKHPQTGKAREPHELTLDALLAIAGALNWIDPASLKTARYLQQFRNFVHIHVQRSDSEHMVVNKNVCAISWQVMKSILDQISQHVSGVNPLHSKNKQ